MTPRGSTIGADNWRKRWEEKERILETVDWATFRRDAQLMEGIQTGAHRFDLWYERAKSAGIEPRHFEDSRFGKPHGRIVDGVFATANSLRMACYVHTIAAHWERWDWRPFNVLDIGGGYGGFAWALRVRGELGPSRYFVLDAQPCFHMQYKFTRRAGLTPAEWYNVAEGLDLVVNTNSFGEMDTDDVCDYFEEHIKPRLEDGGAFYTMNRLERVTNFADYPYGPGWRHVLVRHPFRDEAWVECLSVRDRRANEPHPATRL